MAASGVGPALRRARVKPTRANFRLLLLTGSFIIGNATSFAAEAGQIPAFPGAEGFGAYAKGGRGGDVYHVTNLESSGPGSFAEGLTNNVPPAGRTIVFEVSGYADITGKGGKLTVKAPNITVAGQTAPGDGFGLKNGTFWVSANDFVIRFIRFRDGKSADAVDYDSNSTNSIFDHCSVMLGKDENFSTWKPPENNTFQWSFNAWGMETHSCGGLWNVKHGTVHHTLWAHNHTRNPKARPDDLLDWINNVTFDWDIGFILGDSEGTADWKANVRGCYFVCAEGNLRPVALEKGGLIKEGDRKGQPNFSLYLDDCAMDGNGNGTLDVTKTGYALVSGAYTKRDQPFPSEGAQPVIRDDFLTGYKKVLSNAGPVNLEVNPSLPLRDELDTILVREVVAQKKHRVKSPAETGASNGGFGTLKSSPAPVDTDRDGLPDYWESTLGSNPAKDDHNQPVANLADSYFPAGTPAGYTLLEEYLHFLAIPHAVLPKGTPALTIDLRKFTAGFAKTAKFTVAKVSGGTATLGADGFTVRFSPAKSGRGKFEFTVKDADGSTWTQQLAVLVSAK